MNMRSIKVCISNHATVFREHVPTLTFYFQAFWTLLTVTFGLALHGHHATIRRSWSLNPWKPFRSGLGMGKARWCSVFNLVFRLVDQKALRPTLGMISLSFIFIYGLYIYIFFFGQNAKRTHPKNWGDLLIQTKPETLSAFSDLEIPTVWGTTGGFTKKAQVSCGAFWWPAYWTAK